MTARGLFASSLVYGIVLFTLWPLLMFPFRSLLSRCARRAGSYAEDRLHGFASRKTTTPTGALPIKGIRIETVRQPAPADTIEDRLRELARLKDVGAITPEDYETRKREILSEL